MIITGAVLVVLGIVAFAFSDDPAYCAMSPTKTARASGCAGRARIGGQLNAGPELVT
jgi:hypothetical protein